MEGELQNPFCAQSFFYFCLIYVIIFEAYANFLLLLSFIRSQSSLSCLRVAYLFSFPAALCVCAGVCVWVLAEQLKTMQGERLPGMTGLKGGLKC